MQGRRHHCNGGLKLLMLYSDATLLPIVTIAGAAGVAFIIGMILFLCVLWPQKTERNKIKAASDTSVAYRNTMHTNSESDQKFAETAISDHICYEHANRDAVLCENESYGHVFTEEGKEK